MNSWMCAIIDQNDNIRLYAVAAKDREEAIRKVELLFAKRRIRWSLKLTGEREPQHVYTFPLHALEAERKLREDAEEAIRKMVARLKPLARIIYYDSQQAQRAIWIKELTKDPAVQRAMKKEEE